MMNDQSLGWPQLKVREFMAPNAVPIRAESSLSEVAATLAEYDISGLPVVDRGGAVIGVMPSVTPLIARGIPWLRQGD
jgi:CBS domain-containing protein